MKIKTTKDRQKRISLRQRKRISGTPERPRLRVFRSVSHIYAQVIDDMSGTTVASARGGNVAGAKALGKTIADRLQEKGIKRVVFDRGGYLYHGRIKAVAEAAREAGLEF
jgi:large subunit ribosomal protein L18